MLKIFNIQQSTAEVLLGVPPLAIQNRINTVKRFLELVVLSSPKDPLKDALQEQLSENTSINYQTIIFSIKQLFYYLPHKSIHIYIIKITHHSISTTKIYINFLLMHDI